LAKAVTAMFAIAGIAAISGITGFITAAIAVFAKFKKAAWVVGNLAKILSKAKHSAPAPAAP